MKTIPIVKKYLRTIAAAGGRKSRRMITPEQQEKMQNARKKLNKDTEP